MLNFYHDFNANKIMKVTNIATAINTIFPDPWNKVVNVLGVLSISNSLFSLRYFLRIRLMLNRAVRNN